MQNTDFCLSDWTAEDYERLKKHLKELADPSYLSFHQKLVPGVENLLGIRIPVLRGLAKEIAKGGTDGCHSYFALTENTCYEEVMLYGMVIGLARLDLSALCRELDRFVPLIDNWAVCDTCCAGLKAAKKYPEKMLAYLQKYLCSEQEFELRFALVMLMDYYIDDRHIDLVLDKFGAVRHPGYYVKMAAAWGLSVCLVKYRDRTLEFLKQCGLDDFTYNKTLQKAIESDRISKEDKELFRSMKRQKKA